MSDDANLHFYEGLADEYHLIYGDWKQSVARQADVLDRIIRAEIGGPPIAILDCTCGIGTQTIGLAQRGYRVRGTDRSPASITRAQVEAQAVGVSVSFGIADVRTLDRQVKDIFDVVIACDNSLPHLLTDRDLGRATRAIHAKLHPGGLFLASIRDYDRLIADRPRAELPRVFDDPSGRRIVFQVWDWSDDGSRYVVHLFILQEANGVWTTSHHQGEYRALQRRELQSILLGERFSNVRWLMPDESGFHQPIVVARKSNIE